VKQVDLNGAVSYTSLARTTCNNHSFVVSLYPIPARDKLTLTVNSDKALKTTAQLVDNYGRLMMNVPLNISKGTSKWSDGMYGATVVMVQESTTAVFASSGNQSRYPKRLPSIQADDWTRRSQ
jgi:hypothetical protein